MAPVGSRYCTSKSGVLVFFAIKWDIGTTFQYSDSVHVLDLHPIKSFHFSRVEYGITVVAYYKCSRSEKLPD